MRRLMNARFRHVHLMTGLPEYRNGGLLIDTGLLTLKDADFERGKAQYHATMQRRGAESMEVVPAFEPSDDVIVEWRAVTVGFLDEIAKSVNERLNLKGDKALSLAQVLEAGTWKVCVFVYMQHIMKTNKSRAVERLPQCRDQTPKNHQL